MKKIIVIFSIVLLLTGADVFAQGDLIVNGNIGAGTTTPISRLDVQGWVNIDSGGGGIKISNRNPDTFTVENASGEVNFKMLNLQGAHPIVFQMKSDQTIGGHFSIVPGGRFGYWLFEDTTSGFDPDFRVCGYPTGASSNQCVSLMIEGVNNDLNMSTDGPGSDILLMPQANVGIGTSNPTEKLEVEGNIYATGTVTWGSSRELKQDIRELSADEAIAALEGLHPQKYYYRADTSDEHIGFIAEDVPELLATKDRKSLDPMDIVGVLTRVVQEQQKTIDQLTREVNELKREVVLRHSLATAME